MEESIPNLVGFIASSGAYMTGSVVRVDGGGGLMTSEENVLKLQKLSLDKQQQHMFLSEIPTYQYDALAIKVGVLL